MNHRRVSQRTRTLVAIATAAAVVLSTELPHGVEAAAHHDVASITPMLVSARTAPRAAWVSGTFHVTRTGKVRVSLTTNARLMRVRYRAPNGNLSLLTLRVPDRGRAGVTLPRGAAGIVARAMRGGGVAASRWVRVRILRTLPTKPGQPPATTDDAFRIVIVPDTQLETRHRPQAFIDRMQWIADTAASQKIRYVVQVGDLVDTDNCGIGSYELVDNDPTRPRCNEEMRANHVYYPLPDQGSHYQYANADAGISVLEEANIPYSLAVGNHDSAAVCGGPACTDPPSQLDWAVPPELTTNFLLRQTRTWDTTFPPSRFPDGQFMDPASTANMYRTFEAGGLDWLVLSLEMWPRSEVIDWAGSVAAAHPRHNVVITTHHYLSRTGTLSSSNGGYGDTSPQQLFDRLISAYPNVRLVFSGHNNGFVNRRDVGAQGNPVLSTLSSFHDRSNNQSTVMTIDPSSNTASAVTYVQSGHPEIVSGSAFEATGMDWVR